MRDAFFLALGLFTRLPVPLVEPKPVTFGRSVLFFPVVGLLLGLAMAGVGALLWSSLPHFVVAGIAVALIAALSGGLHLDGLADTFDALGVSPLGDAAARRERMLAVMRDPRMGPIGGAALTLVLLIKVSALSQSTDLVGWVLVPLLSRWLAGVLFSAFPYARQEGAGRAWHGTPTGLEGLLGSSLIIIVVVFLGPVAIGAVVAGAGVGFGFAAYMNRRLGGLTGDVYGAAIELCEVATAVALVVS